jgi:hypothetical protein
MAQGGNVHEWEETDIDLVNGPSPSSTFRGLRGGNRTNQPAALTSLLRFGGTPDQEGVDVGFRVASVRLLPGDYNGNGIVDAADNVVWRKLNDVPAAYNTWRANFGQPSGSGSFAGLNATVPEPDILVLIILAATGGHLRRCRIVGKLWGQPISPIVDAQAALAVNFAVRA